MKAEHILLLCVLMCVASAGAAGGEERQASAEAGLTLIVTSATSGMLFGEGEETIASFAATVRDAADEARREGRTVVVLDAGRTVLPYAESRHDGGAAMMRVLESVGCDVFAPAPIDFSLGLPELGELADAASFAFIRPFVAEYAEGASALTEFAEIAPPVGPVLEFVSIMNPSYVKDLASIGVVEATAASAPTDPSAADRLRVAVIHSRGHGNEVAGRILTLSLLNSPGGIDVLFDPDLGIDAVMRSVSGDRPVVLAGRDQDKNPPWTAARLDLDLELVDGAWQIVGTDMEILEADPSSVLDPGLVTALAAAGSHFRKSQDVPFQFGGPSNLKDLKKYVMSALQEQARAEVVVLNRGALRPVASHHFAEGELSREAVVRLLAFDQAVVVGKLTGDQLKALAAESVQRVHPDGTYRMGSLVFAGLTFDVAKEGTRDATVSKVQVNGRPIRGDDLYSVASNNFLASGGDEYPILAGMDGDWLPGEDGNLTELREHVVVPRLVSGSHDFIDLTRKPLWHWGFDRVSLGLNSVTTSRDDDYDDVSDARARANDSTALFGEVRGFLEREQPEWTWENVLWARYGVLDLEGAERRETDDLVWLETSAVLTRKPLFGGHPYSSFGITTEFQPGEDSSGSSLPRRFEQSLALGIDWTAKLWPRIRLGLTGRNYSHTDRDPQIGVVGEAFFKRKAGGGWPAMDGHVLAEHFVNDAGTINRLDLDFRFLFTLVKDLKLTPALNYYLYQDSELSGTSNYFRFSLGLTYGWSGKHQSW